MVRCFLFAMYHLVKRYLTIHTTKGGYKTKTLCVRNDIYNLMTIPLQSVVHIYITLQSNKYSRTTHSNDIHDSLFNETL